MKIALGPQEYDGYVNFGINYKNMDSEVDDGECTEIHAPSILDYISHNEFSDFMQAVFRKMRHGCVLTIGGSDLYESCKQFLRGDYGVIDFNKMLFGDKNIPKLAHYSLNTISDVCVSSGLKVVCKKLNDNYMMIRATRV